MSDDAAIAAIEAMRLLFKLTAREAEVLYWVVKGKTNRDIGEVLARYWGAARPWPKSIWRGCT